MSATRPPDTMRLDTPMGSLEVFERLEVVSTIMGPAEATFELGDETALASLPALQHGMPAIVSVNGHPCIKGRLMSREPSGDTSSGVSVELALETIIGCAQTVSSDPDVSFSTTTLRAFLTALYGRVTGVPSLFSWWPVKIVTNYSLERDLLTGRPTKGGKIDPSIEMVLGESVKVQPPEAIYETAAKNLRRFGVGHWDTPDGNIFVGKPDETQAPIGRFVLKRGPAAVANNVIRVRRSEDWRGVPSVVRTHGIQGAPEVNWAPIVGEASYADVTAQAGYRPVIVKGSIIGENLAQAKGQAKRELAVRSKRKDALELEVDGWAWWDGSALIPYAPNTMWDVDLDVLGGVQGSYLCLSVSRRLDPRGGPTTTLQLTARGTFSF